jgi:K+-transporting ATPase KdpF subunit
MVFDYWLAGIVTAGILVYLVYALLTPEKFYGTFMTLNGWIQIAIYFVVLTALVVPLGRFMAQVLVPVGFESR